MNKKRQLCAMHYTRWRRHGDPLVVLRGAGDLASFEARVDRSGGPDACHPWTGAVDSNGYGVVWLNGRADRAHRVAWAAENGPIPPGVEVDHECHNWAVEAGECSRGGPCPHRLCANPSHVKPKSSQQHRDDTPPWRHPRGEVLPQSKLTETDVRQIRQLLVAEVPRGVIARVFGVSVRAVMDISSGRTWSWLE